MKHFKHFIEGAVLIPAGIIVGAIVIVWPLLLVNELYAKTGPTEATTVGILLSVCYISGLVRVYTKRDDD